MHEWKWFGKFNKIILNEAADDSSFHSVNFDLWPFSVPEIPFQTGHRLHKWKYSVLGSGPSQTLRPQRRQSHQPWSFPLLSLWTLTPWPQPWRFWSGSSLSVLCELEERCGQWPPTRWGFCQSGMKSKGVMKNIAIENKTWSIKNVKYKKKYLKKCQFHKPRVCFVECNPCGNITFKIFVEHFKLYSKSSDEKKQNCVGGTMVWNIF